MNGQQPHDAATIARLRALWEWRAEMCGGVERMPETELSAFGWWFSGGHFDPSWAYHTLEIILRRTDVSRSNLHVLEYMSEKFNDYPRESLRCIRLFMEKNDDHWFFVSSRKQKGLWTMLEQGLHHPDSDIRGESENIVHLLGSKGHLAFRELLAKKSES